MPNVKDYRAVCLLVCEGWHFTYIISLRGEIWAHKISLALPLFIEVAVPSQKSVPSCICVRGIDFDSFYDFHI